MADPLKPDPIDVDTQADAEPVDPETLMRRRANRPLFEENEASHQGGAGAQGGQADFGSVGNLSGIDGKR